MNKIRPWLLRTDIVLITGGKTGLGAAIVDQFAEYGCQTISIDLYARDPNITDATIVDYSKEMRPTANHLVAPIHMHCDVRNEKQIQQVKHMIFHKFKRYPSVVILNAAVRGPIMSVVDTPVTALENTVDVNLIGAIRCIKAFLPEIVTMKRGFLVNVASALGIIIPKGFSVYGASKAGLIGLHEGLVTELADMRNVHALLVCPGQLDTELFSDVQTPSNLLAPVVSRVKLAEKIFKRVKRGQDHTVYAPLYVRYLALVKVAPLSVLQAARKVSRIDGVYDQALNHINQP